MTKVQFTALFKEKGLDNGHFLAFFTKHVLSNINLTLLQDSTLHQLSGGNYQPHDSVMYKSVLEVLQLASEDKADSLITLLKRLPVPETNRAVQYFTNGVRVTRADYFSGDTIKGKRHIKGLNTSKKPYEDMTEEQFHATLLSGARAGDIMGVKHFGKGYLPTKTVCRNPATPYQSAEVKKSFGDNIS